MSDRVGDVSWLANGGRRPVSSAEASSSPADVAEVVVLYRERSDKDWSLTDCISFVIMQQRGLSDALTADLHFVQAGFRALLLD